MDRVLVRARMTFKAMHFYCSNYPGISNIDLEIVAGHLCSVVGIVGSGKSTLLQVILGELELDSGSVTINGTISYASQEPWLFEGTIRNNIVFIEEFDEQRYGIGHYLLNFIKCTYYI